MIASPPPTLPLPNPSGSSLPAAQLGSEQPTEGLTDVVSPFLAMLLAPQADVVAPEELDLEVVSQPLLAVDDTTIPDVNPMAVAGEVIPPVQVDPHPAAALGTHSSHVPGHRSLVDVAGPIHGKPTTPHGPSQHALPPQISRPQPEFAVAVPTDQIRNNVESSLLTKPAVQTSVAAAVPHGVPRSTTSSSHTATTNDSLLPNKPATTDVGNTHPEFQAKITEAIEAVRSAAEPTARTVASETQTERVKVPGIESVSAHSSGELPTDNNLSAPLWTPHENNATTVASERGVSSANRAPMVTQLHENLVGIQHSLKDGKAQVEIDLNPPELGKMLIELTEENEQLKAKLVVARPATAEAVKSALPELLRSLSDSGVEVAEFDLRSSADDRQTPANEQEVPEALRRPLRGAAEAHGVASFANRRPGGVDLLA